MIVWRGPENKHEGIYQVNTLFWFVLYFQMSGHRSERLHTPPPPKKNKKQKQK